MHPLHTLTHRLISLVSVFLAVLSLSAAAQMAAPQEGNQYLRLKNPQPVESGKKIEVIEFFSYGCPHCGALEPALQGWLKTLPADVQFRRVPVMFQERWTPLAKIYYTLEALGEESRLSPDVFTALHGNGHAPVAGQDVLRLGGGAWARPEEGRGHVQLVRDRRQGQPRAHDRAGVPGPIGPADRRRRQVREQSRAFPQRDAAADRRIGGQGAHRTAEDLNSVFITGASSGLGEALARHYAAQGMTIGLFARRRAELDALASALPPGGRSAAYSGDVRDADALALAAADFIARFGVPDIVIANAGISQGALTDHREDLPTFRTVFDTNVVGVVHTFQPFIAAMKVAGRGTLVGIASIAGFRGLPGSGAYSASKAAAITYLESLRVELRGTGVAVLTVCPGYIATPMTAKNPYPMPFVLHADEAARRIARAIERRKRFYVLPWPMAIVGRVLRILPRPIYDALFAHAPRKPRRSD